MWSPCICVRLDLINIGSRRRNRIIKRNHILVYVEKDAVISGCFVEMKDKSKVLECSPKPDPCVMSFLSA